MVDGFDVDPDDLRALAAKIADCVSGVGGTESLQVSGGPETYGNEAVHKAVDEFCDAVEMSLDVMRKTAESAAGSVRDSARQYEQQDNSAGLPMSQIGSNMAGGL